jgi:predicted aspartyl protease
MLVLEGACKMYKLQYKNGLLYASLEIYADNKKVVIENVIIDTGASHTIILTDFLEQLDIPLLDDDELVRSSGYGGEQYTATKKDFVHKNWRYITS